MTDSTRPDANAIRPPAPSAGEPVPTLADDDTDPDREQQGRIGYGRWGRLSPIGLALLILVTLGVIWVMDQDNADDETDGLPSSTTTGELQDPRPAPEFELALMNGEGTVSLEELRGNTVVVNFWASWCAPCREEMPALQESAEAHAGDEVVFVGVGAKNDKQDAAEAFVEEFGITYPIGRDTEGGDSLSGQIEKAFGVPGYPATFFITPEGMINQIVFGPLEIEDLDTYITNTTD
ncbi:MAG TPA: TlpA disulfide reductase family protein [Thermomicrobiales bacterium]|nr:TlpA disulfide reductase family protein [Thermomicrobiales bacterium]